MRFADYSVALPQGADRRAGRHVPRAAADAGRLARLLPRRPGRSTRSTWRCAWSAGSTRRSASSRASSSPPARRRRLGSDEFWDMAEGQLRERPKRTGMPYTHRSGRWRVLRAEDRRLHRGRARPRVADGDRSRSTTSCRSASTWSTAPPTAASSARSIIHYAIYGVVRALHRRSSPSTTPVPSRCGWRRCR